jgi:hypothetical protein
VVAVSGGIEELAERIRRGSEEAIASLPPSAKEEIDGLYAEAALAVVRWLSALQRHGLLDPAPPVELAVAASIGLLATKILCEVAAELRGEEGSAAAIADAARLVFSDRMYLALAAALRAAGGGR